MKIQLNENELKEALNMYLASRNLQVTNGKPKMEMDGDWGRETFIMTIEVEPKSDGWGR